MKKAFKIKTSLQGIVARLKSSGKRGPKLVYLQQESTPPQAGLDLWQELQRRQPQLPIEQVLAHYHRSGNPALASRIYVEFRHLVLGVALRLLDDRAAAEDATTDVFLKVLDRLRVELPHNFPGWLYTVTRYHCFELRRRAKSGPIFEPVDQLRHIADESPAAEACEERSLLITDAVREALVRLPGHQKVCIEQFFIQGRSYKEIAKAQGLSLKEVKSFIQNGKRRLAAFLLPLRSRLASDI